MIEGLKCWGEVKRTEAWLSQNKSGEVTKWPGLGLIFLWGWGCYTLLWGRALSLLFAVGFVNTTAQMTVPWISEVTCFNMCFLTWMLKVHFELQLFGLSNRPPKRLINWWKKKEKATNNGSEGGLLLICSAAGKNQQVELNLYFKSVASDF